MKLRKSSGGVDKVEQQMTPMIDIVFQLLTFFLFSFKIVAPEGDFNIKMPVAAQATAKIDDITIPIKVRMTAGGDGTLAALTMSDKQLANFAELRLQVVGIIGGAAGPGSAAENTEVELDCDYNLKYEYVIKAIDAVSGEKDAEGHVTKLVQKIKFAPPKKP